MKNILDAPFVKGMMKTTANMYRLGWDERNGGNISMMLDPDEVAEYLDINAPIRSIAMGFDAKVLVGKIFIVTGTGKYFKNVEDDPENNLGIIKVAEGGTTAELLWGYSDGGRPTSELPAHLMSHISRLEKNPENRVIMHSHPTNTLAMTYVHELDEKKLTHSLWEMCTECMVVFPDGIGVVPWMVPGGRDIALATAELMKKYDVAVWAHHGIFCSGEDFDLTFGLMDTVEKSAEILVKVLSMGGKHQTITAPDFRALAKDFNLTLPEKFLYE